MKRTIGYVALALAVCGLFQPAGVTAKEQVERAWHGQDTTAEALMLPDGSWTMIEVGEATHIGLNVNTGSGVGPYGSGIAIAANGDELWWDSVSEVDPATGTMTGTIAWTGGTGRFENASGSADFESSSLEIELLPDGSRLLTWTYSSRGTITY